MLEKLSFYFFKFWGLLFSQPRDSYTAFCVKNRNFTLFSLSTRLERSAAQERRKISRHFANMVAVVVDCIIQKLFLFEAGRLAAELQDQKTNKGREKIREKKTSTISRKMFAVRVGLRLMPKQVDGYRTKTSFDRNR